jgi:ABC-type antimicrobial peptide transport system permease subunit
MLYEQVPYASQTVSFALRTTDAQMPVLQAARRAIQTTTSRLALQRTVTMQSVFEDAVGAPGRVATLLTILAGLALVLGAVGVYGVISHAVSRRTRDYGVQIALGLSPSRVVSHVVRRGVVLAVAGCVLGLGVTIAMTDALSSLLYGVEHTDAAALGGAVAALIAVGAIAAFIPAWRASRTDPAVVLREQ